MLRFERADRPLAPGRYTIATNERTRPRIRGRQHVEPYTYPDRIRR
jgi:hypothetical protein